VWLLDEENDGLVFEGGRLYKAYGMMMMDIQRHEEKKLMLKLVCVMMMEEGERCSRGGREEFLL
jgi:hypothetical protein